jgi:serine/threonine-protein kinase
MAQDGAQELDAGTVIGGCRIVRVIGRGGMGVVYLAEQEALGREVAVKVIAPAFARDVEFRQRFERESRLAASLHHPSVVPVYAAGEDDGRLFTVMRYIGGSDLRLVLSQEGALAPTRAVRIASGVAAALDAAHAADLVHRDVKPANVLLTSAGDGESAYLTDFGLTKKVSSQSAITATGQWVGTLDYIAPEQLEHDRVDGRADIYALGCVLFEMLTGRTPYVGTTVQKMWAHVNLPPPSVAEVAPAAGALDAVVKRAMAKAPEDRYPTAGALAEAATAAARRVPDLGPEARTRVMSRGPTSGGGRGRRVRPLLVLVAVAVVGAVAALLLATGGGDDDGTQTPVPAGKRIRGTNGADSLTGGPGADRIAALAGDDELDGGDGPDRLAAGAGDDVVAESEDDSVDVVTCGPGRDVVAKPDTRDVLATDCEQAGWTASSIDGPDENDVAVVPRTAGRRVSFRATCRARCVGTIELRTPRTRELLGQGSFELPTARRADLVAQLNRRGTAYVRGGRRIRVVIRARRVCRCPDPPPIVASGFTLAAAPDDQGRGKRKSDS